MSRLPRDVGGYEAMLERAADDLLAVNKRLSALVSHQVDSPESLPLTGADLDRLTAIATSLQNVAWHAGTAISNLSVLDVHPKQIRAHLPPRTQGART